jgi:hypothetical protein
VITAAATTPIRASRIIRQKTSLVVKGALSHSLVSMNRLMGKMRSPVHCVKAKPRNQIITRANHG